MARSRLRVYFGPDDMAEPDLTARRRLVTVALKDLAPLIVDAARTQRAWLKDFNDEEVTISEDLHEILQAYAAMRAA